MSAIANLRREPRLVAALLAVIMSGALAWSYVWVPRFLQLHGPPCATLAATAPGETYGLTVQARSGAFHPDGVPPHCALMVEETGEAPRRAVALSGSWTPTFDAVRWLDDRRFVVEQSSWPHPRKAGIQYLARRALNLPLRRTSRECAVSLENVQRDPREKKLRGRSDDGLELRVACTTHSTAQ